MGTVREVSPDSLWWVRDDLKYINGFLSLGGEDLNHLAKSSGGPCFVYSAARVTRNLSRLKNTLAGFGPNSRLLYAMKANRFSPLLAHLRSSELDGVDVCSPNELRLARQVGFRESEISFTGTSVANADLDVLAAHPGVWVNCDSLSTLKRLGERCRGRKVGLRINQEAGVAYAGNERLNYTGAVSKFGIYWDQMDEAFEIASRYGMEITGLHFHAGCGYLTPQLEDFRAVLEKAKPFIQRVPNLDHVNFGGGIGVPIVEHDAPLDLNAWQQVIKDVYGDTPDFAVWIEPGDYLVKDAGVMILEVNTIEEKGGRLFAGTNGGFNLHPEPAFYNLPLEIVPCMWRPGEERAVKVVGNINEALDVFYEEISLPPIEEGDFLAFLNAGGYGSSMSSNHCMRGNFSEFLVIESN